MLAGVGREIIIKKERKRMSERKREDEWGERERNILIVREIQ